MKRIGELLAKAVTLLLIKDAEQKRHIIQAPATPPPANGGNQIADTSDRSGRNGDTGNSVLEYLSRVGDASPQEIQSALNLTRSTTYRIMDRLTEGGMVLRKGQTRSVRYSLKADVKQMNPNLQAEDGHEYDK